MATTETETETNRVVPTWRRLLVAAGWFALVLVAVSAAVYLFNRHRLMSQLDQVMKELDESDPGWRWDGLLAARGEIREEENSVPRILVLVRDVPRGWPDPRNEEKFEGLSPNMSLDVPRQKAMDELMAVHPIPRLRVEARELARFPRGRIEVVVPENPTTMLYRDHDKVRVVARLLSFDAHALALVGQHGEALKAARASLNVSRAMEDDPTLIGQLIRVSLSTVALGTAEKVMALGDAPDDALAALQDALKHEGGRTGLVLALRGERATAHQALGLIATGKRTVHEIAGGPPTDEWWGQEWFESVAGPERARREHAEVLRLMTKMVDAAKLPAKDQFAAEDDVEKRITSLSGGVMVRLLVPAARKVNEMARRSQCMAVAMRGLIAVERYRLKHGKWPAKLEDTVPEFLERVPLDPIDERSIRYAKWAEGVVVYSIGNDRTDDGGEVGRPFKDIGYRLWDSGKRRAAPPPLPPDMPP